MKININLYFLYLSIIILIIFILQQIIPGFTELFILNEKANNLQIWRFVTSIFLHGSLTHLLFNLFALLFFGIILEKQIGSKNFLTVFFLSGIIANIIAINYYNSSLGASGAIYGIIGALTIINPFIMVLAFGLIMPMFLAAILWIIADILRTIGVFNTTNIGTIAHLSGITIGIIYGIYLKINKKIKIKDKKIRLTINEGNIEEWENNFVK